MRNLLFLVLGLAIVLVSCTKEKVVDNEKVLMRQYLPNENYMPLEIGNYWVYQLITIDSIGNESVSYPQDSILVTGDTLINENMYSVIEGIYHPYEGGEWQIVRIVRDSLGYLVNEKGQILFSKFNFSDVLTTITGGSENAPLFVVDYKMEECEFQVQVPAGSFDVYNFKGTMRDLNSGNVRYLNNYYANNIGLIQETVMYFSSSTYMERRLVRYGNLN